MRTGRRFVMEEVKTQEAPAPAADLKANWKWYVIHTYSGYEAKAKAALEERVRSMHMEHKIGAVLPAPWLGGAHDDCP